MLLAATIAGVAALAASCADFDAVVDPTGGLPDVAVAEPTLSRDVQPIFTKRCSIGGCHSLASAQAGLVLTEGRSHDALVNVPSRLGTQLLVSPGSPDASWLIAMIGPDPARRLGFSRMPLASHPLTTNQIATIAKWIERGAARD